jgi:hypothetical protein
MHAAELKRYWEPRPFPLGRFLTLYKVKGRLPAGRGQLTSRGRWNKPPLLLPQLIVKWAGPAKSVSLFLVHNRMVLKLLVLQFLENAVNGSPKSTLRRTLYSGAQLLMEFSTLRNPASGHYAVSLV